MSPPPTWVSPGKHTIRRTNDVSRRHSALILAGTAAFVLGRTKLSFGDDAGTTTGWVQVQPMSTGRNGAVSAVSGGRWFVGFGNGSTGGTSGPSIEVYDPTSDRWTVVPSPGGMSRIELAAA